MVSNRPLILIYLCLFPFVSVRGSSGGSMQCSCITLVNELLIWNQFWWKKYFQKYFYVKKLSTESLKILYFKYETFLSEKSLITLYNAPFCWNFNSKLVIPGSHLILTLSVPLLSPPTPEEPLSWSPAFCCWLFSVAPHSAESGGESHQHGLRDNHWWDQHGLRAGHTGGTGSHARGVQRGR